MIYTKPAAYYAHWECTDPAAPPRPPKAGENLPWWIPSRRATGERRWKIALGAGFVGASLLWAPNLGLWVANVLAIAISQEQAAGPGSLTTALGVLLLVPLTIAIVRRPAAIVLTQVVRHRGDAARRAQREWLDEHSIRQGDLPDGPVRDLADTLVKATGALLETRTVTEDWAGSDWARVLRTRQWSLLARLRDSVAVRAGLDAADALRARTAELDQVVAVRREQIETLERNVRATVAELTGATAEAQALDTALAAADATRADLDTAAALAVQLGSVARTSADVDREHRRIREDILASAAGEDLSILTVQLRALTQHVRGDSGGQAPR